MICQGKCSWSRKILFWSAAVVACVVLIPPTALAQQAPAPVLLEYAPGRAITLTRIDPAATPITIDGRLDEPVWQSIAAIDDFVVLEPDTLEPGEHPSYLRVAYSDRGLYVSADFHQPQETLVKRFSGRDQRDNRDSFSVTVDTSGEGRYGFSSVTGRACVEG